MLTASAGDTLERVPKNRAQASSLPRQPSRRRIIPWHGSGMIRRWHQGEYYANLQRFESLTGTVKKQRIHV
jgi:hypothetical protein